MVIIFKISYIEFMNTRISHRQQALENHRQQALDKVQGDEDIPRRPLTGYEWNYEVAANGALYSIRRQRFLKPIFNNEKGSVEIEFEHNSEIIRLSPGKAVALSFFTPIQRERIADEAYQELPFQTYDDLKGHPAIERLAYKYDVTEGAIFYIMMTSMPSKTDTKKEVPEEKPIGRRYKNASRSR